MFSTNRVKRKAEEKRQQMKENKKRKEMEREQQEKEILRRINDLFRDDPLSHTPQFQNALNDIMQRCRSDADFCAYILNPFNFSFLYPQFVKQVSQQIRNAEKAQRSDTPSQGHQGEARPQSSTRSQPAQQSRFTVIEQEGPPIRRSKPKPRQPPATATPTPRKRQTAKKQKQASNPKTRNQRVTAIIEIKSESESDFDFLNDNE